MPFSHLDHADATLALQQVGVESLNIVANWGHNPQTSYDYTPGRLRLQSDPQYGVSRKLRKRWNSTSAERPATAQLNLTPKPTFSVDNAA
jgi:hypothetical protein